MIIAFALTCTACVVLAVLVFSLAIYALPVAVGFASASLAHASGAGLLGAAAVGLIAGSIAYAAGHVAIETTRSPAVRITVLLLYVFPAAVVGFSIAHGLVAMLVPAELWRVTFSLVGASAVAAAAWTRMTTLAPSGGTGRSSGEVGRLLLPRQRDQKASYAPSSREGIRRSGSWAAA